MPAVVVGISAILEVVKIAPALNQTADIEKLFALAGLLAAAGIKRTCGTVVTKSLSATGAIDMIAMKVSKRRTQRPSPNPAATIIRAHHCKAARSRDIS